MPNWCYNSLRVDGDNNASLTDFRDWLGKDGFRLNKILTMPKELEDTTSPAPEDQAKIMMEMYGAPDWYSWRVNNWGTKWDVEAAVQDDDSLIFITFDSAWSPPTSAIAALGKMFPDLTFTLSYKEEGMGFAGTFTVTGQSIDDCTIDGASDKDGYRQFCIDEFDTDPFEYDDEEVVS